MAPTYTRGLHVCTYLLVVKLRVIQLRELIREGLDEKPDFNKFLPEDHKVGMRVPKGGSMCANCKWVSDDGKTCGNEYFQDWNGSEKLPAPSDEYCCDLWRKA